VKQRAERIARLVDLAQRLLECQNYFALVAVVHGLSSTLISRQRLPLSWKALPAKKADLLIQLR
jgi:hypothetical protein